MAFLTSGIIAKRICNTNTTILDARRKYLLDITCSALTKMYVYINIWYKMRVSLLALSEVPCHLMSSALNLKVQKVECIFRFISYLSGCVVCLTVCNLHRKCEINRQIEILKLANTEFYDKIKEIC